MSDVFISYAHGDSDFAEILTSNLKAHGLSVFYDRALTTGMNYQELITNELRSSKSVVVLLSKHSKRSKWVESELQAALEGSSNVIPVLLDSEGRDNWVWPLLADRQVIVNKQSTDSQDIMSQILDAVISGLPKNNVPQPLDIPANYTALPRSKSAYASASWIIPVITGVLGALITWLITN